ncbi:phosphate/phosphite/phosphonate ABC transporter substrate-binding protein [Streptomyces afghaniensis]|uniref:phosphate/phosphite/phosphonate ABC transporter substrate-binding protein n=1 Tax=Streptomyces afghaniensis TaxID=66865 RepID=UPI00277F80EE|nr:PhnD/SsuA/transferrin family substrate-binding protein [Streptomyces afghaniensis]MDQ1018621.1 phosphonate transport system substrate-binding protein [Streptomyces afghaniensis]
MTASLVLGAVAYDPKVVTIWDGFRTWFRGQGFAFDYVLYSHYERQVTDLLAGRIDVAWNSPLAWVRARRLAQARGEQVRAVAMRDTDRDLTSVVVVRADSSLTSPAGLSGRTLATGAVDSPQATLLPLELLRTAGHLRDVRVLRFDIGTGLHGDHIGGERAAVEALLAGQADAACLSDTNLLTFSREGLMPSGAVRVIAQTEPYDHCNMTAGPAAVPAAAEEFTRLLLAMDYADAEVRPLLDLEGLKEWRPGRLQGYTVLERAVSTSGFYDERGHVTAADYRP